MGKLFYLMGKSASGKDSIFRELMQEKSIVLKHVVMYTTRPIRDGEVDGVDYHFVTDQKAQKLWEEGKVIELRRYQTVHGIWNYFTVDDGQIDLERQSYCMIGTLESYRKIREYFGADRVVPLYVTVPDGIRLQRALCREMRQPEPKYAEMCRRFLADEEDFKEDNLRECQISEHYENIVMAECVERIVCRIRMEA